MPLRQGDSPPDVDRTISRCSATRLTVLRHLLRTIMISIWVNLVPNNPNPRHIVSTIIALLAGATGDATVAQAGSGFDLRSQSTTLLGSAQAGMTTGSDNASMMVNNPASLGFGNGRELVVGLTGIFTNGYFRDSSATTLLGTPVPGGNGGDNGKQVAIPNLYVATDLADQVRLGLAVTSLYGLGSKWESDWIGRYYAQSSQLVTYDIIPTLSYRPIPTLSVGIAPIIQYAQAKSTTAIDFGTIDHVLLGGSAGGHPGRSDGSIGTRTESWSVGMQLGLLFEPLQGTRIGAAYRSQIRQTLTGDADYNTGGPTGDAVAAATGAFRSGKIQLGLNLPATATIGVSQQMNQAITLMADLQWMGWHALKDLTISSANPLQPPATTPLNWNDSWFFAVGTRYRLSDSLALRAGAAYDQSPARNSTRTPQVPDANSYWVSAGIEWHLSPTLTAEAAYGHIFVTSGQATLSASAPANALRGSLSGNLSGSVDYLALQFASRF
jgi:long-chain fatty acid transport protein